MNTSLCKESVQSEEVTFTSRNKVHVAAQRVKMKTIARVFFSRPGGLSSHPPVTRACSQAGMCPGTRTGVMSSNVTCTARSRCHMFRISQCSEQRLDGAARFCHCLHSRCWFLPHRGRPQCPHHLSPHSRRQTPHHPHASAIERHLQLHHHYEHQYGC